MDATVLAIFLVSTFCGGIVTGLAGFAMGLVVSGVWLHIFTPLQTTTFIVGFGLLVQSYAIWRLRRSFNWRHVVPLIIGSVVGVPIGASLLPYIEPAYLRLGVGVLLIFYGIYGLLAPPIPPLPANRPAEVGIGFVNGILGGMTGLAGVFVTIWAASRGWSRHEQRSVYQPVLLASFILTAISLAAHGAVTATVVKYYLAGLPALGAGMLIGFALYGRIGEATFRKVVLLLLLVSGCVLVVPEILKL